MAKTITTLNRKGESGIKPMNLDIQKQNNLGVVTDEIIDEKEEIEKEKYTLFNYDSDSDNNDENTDTLNNQEIDNLFGF